MSHATLQRHEVTDCESIIIQAGRKVNDFVITFLPDEGFREREILVMEDVIRVTNRNTSRTHLYALEKTNSTSSGADWTIDFREDLKMGKFDSPLISAR
jgi:hypothetical protein